MPEADLIAAVRELARGPFAERAPEHDRAGTFPADNIADLKALRVPAMGLPEELGGLGVSVETQVRVVEEVAYGDGSTAVALNMHLLGVEAVFGLPPFPQRNAVIEDVARNNALLCGPISVPTGELDSRTSGLAVVAEGENLRVNGRVGFASMSEGAKYVTAVGSIDHGEAAEPEFVLLMADLAAPGIRVLHNWDAMGFRGTASHDIAFENVVIPKGEALVAPVSMVRMLAAAAAASPALAQQRPRGVLGICAIWLGLAQAAYDFTLDYVRRRHGFLAGGTPLFPEAGFRSADPWAQFGIGELDFWVETGRTVLYDTVRRVGSFATTAEYTRAMLRTIYTCRRMSEEVAAGAMRVCGAHAYVRTRSLERIYRDMTGSNVMAWKTDLLRQTLGQGALGLPVQIGGPAPA